MTSCDNANKVMKYTLRIIICVYGCKTNFNIFYRYLGKGFSRRQRAHLAEFSKTRVEAKMIFTKRWPTSGIQHCKKINVFNVSVYLFYS
jgi:hypothetical protein